MAANAASNAAWDRNFTAEAQALHRSLCLDPARRQRPDCLRFLAEHPGAMEVGASAAPAGRDLHWSSVKGWAAAPQRKLRGAGAGGLAAPLEPEALRASHWAGMIPKVSCIVALPMHGTSMRRVEDVVREFHRQTYEGPTQLVLVHHHEDLETAEAVRMLADGFHIKGAAARGPVEDYPSSAALRFGAWSSDGDAVARWAHDEEHHPKRISLQVRALALAARPASVLVPAGGAAAPGDATLLGEAAWMRENWWPMLEEQRAILEGAEAHHIVGVAAGPELLPPRSDLAVCDGVAAEPRSGGDGVEQRLGEALGEDHLARFRLLAAKRAETSERLVALCAEARGESGERRQRLRAAAERIAAIRAELDGHFARLEALYGA